jgi:maleate cis-trans isomerase
MGQLLQRYWMTFVMDIGSCIAAMRAPGLEKVAVLASEGMQEGMAEYFAHAGIELATASAARPDGGENPGCDSLSVAYRGAVALRRSAPAAQGEYIPRANRPTVGMIHDLEEEDRHPRRHQRQAMMWRAHQMAGVNPASVQGFGRPFQTG